MDTDKKEAHYAADRPCPYATHVLHLKCGKCGFVDLVFCKDAKDWNCQNCIMNTKEKMNEKELDVCMQEANFVTKECLEIAYEILREQYEDCEVRDVIELAKIVVGEFHANQNRAKFNKLRESIERMPE